MTILTFFNEYFTKEGTSVQRNRSHYRMAHHGVGLPRARLAIGKDTCIDTFKCSFEDIRAQVLIDLKLEKKRNRILIYAKSGKCKQSKIPSLERQMKGFFYQQSHTKSHRKTPSAHAQEEWLTAENC